jgi:hypothetical protein
MTDMENYVFGHTVAYHSICHVRLSAIPESRFDDPSIQRSVLSAMKQNWLTVLWLPGALRSESADGSFRSFSEEM